MCFMLQLLFKEFFTSINTWPALTRIEINNSESRVSEFTNISSSSSVIVADAYIKDSGVSEFTNMSSRSSVIVVVYQSHREVVSLWSMLI
jgi:hypothetical protein